MLFALICDAQAQEVRIVEKMADGSYVVAIDNTEYRAITGAKAVELAKQKVELEGCKANEVRFNDLITIEKQNTTIANQRADLEHGNFIRAMQMFEGERKLRVEASTQFIPHGKVGGFGGKFLSFLDGPYGQSLFKLVIPTAQFIKVMKQ